MVRLRSHRPGPQARAREILTNAAQNMPLLGMPSELLLLIFSDIPFSANVALRSTCRRLRALCEQLSLPKPTMQDFLYMESWPQFCPASREPHRCHACAHADELYETPIEAAIESSHKRDSSADDQDLFACFMCLRLKPAGAFNG